MTPELPATDPAGPVVLIGFMGAGKSTVGAVLARNLGVDYLDTDHEIVRRTGRSIADIFATDGEERFREVETAVIADVLTTHRGVVALGGGAVLSPGVRQILTGHRVVHLDVAPDVGFARVEGSPRPLLRVDADGHSPRERYTALHAARAAVYAEVATVRVDTDDADPATVAGRVRALLDPRTASPDPSQPHRSDPREVSL
ncbi:shikimate kinase [Williamsia sp. MIQD14]|uniref:shikimate kinase n=1 Tax=Williamsia sp. MIQD14 TaxID=3425703 RepID=UPI003DA155DC